MLSISTGQRSWLTKASCNAFVARLYSWTLRRSDHAIFGAASQFGAADLFFADHSYELKLDGSPHSVGVSRQFMLTPPVAYGFRLGPALPTRVGRSQESCKAKGLDRLRQVMIKSCVARPLNVARLSPSSECDKQNSSAPRLGPDSFGQGIASDARHTDIKNRGVRCESLSELEG